MSAAQKIIDKKALQVLVPFNALSPVHFNEVAQKTVIEEVRAGRLVFKEGDTDNQSVYLLSGEISLVTGNQVVGTVTAGSDASRHPIAHQQPRQVTARAKTSVVVARVDSSLLDIMLTWDQSSGYEVSEIGEDEDDDWMTRILQSQAFLKLPPSNIQRLLMQVESLPAKAGDVIIRQGGDGDYFYIIKSGRCMVTRKPSANAKEVKLAELKDGDAFGEDALVSDAKRNATVTMITDGSLMRLAKKDFVELLKEPLLNKLNYAEAAAKVAKGAIWLDVRLPGEYENLHLQDSRNIPLSALRLEANGLSAATKYIVCCDTGRRSASAAFVLSQRGFDVYVLSEGLGGVPSEALRGASANSAPEPEATPKGAEAPTRAAEPIASAPGQTVAAGNAGAAAMQGQIESLEAEKRELTQQQVQLTERVGDLLEELERVRSEAREQILELEQTLADARQESAAAEAAVNEMRVSMEARTRANETAQELSDALEAELTERRGREAQLNSELKALRARLADLESAHRDHESLKTDAEAKQADHVRRIADLEATVAAHVTAHNEAMQRVEAATRQVAELQGELTASLESRSALEARLAAAAGAQTQAVAASEQAVAELQTRVGTLEAELQQRATEAAAQEARIDSVTAERDRLQAEQAASGTDRDGLQVALADAQVRIEALQAAGGERVSKLEAALAVANEQLQAELARSAALQSGQADSEDERNELRAALEQAQARIRALEATSGEQVQRLEATLEEARREAKALESELARLNSERNDVEGRIAAADARAAELDAALRTQAEAANALQLRFEQVQEEVRRANGAASAGQDEVAALRADAEQRAAEYHETVADLRQQLSSLEQALKEASVERDLLAAEQAVVSDHGVQDEVLAQLRAELTETQDRLRDTDKGRADAMARLAETSAAIETARREHEQALNEIEQRVREESQLQIRELTSDLEGARSALARVQGERDNLNEATKAGRLAEQAELEIALAEARTTIQAREQALSQTQAVERTLRSELDELRATAEAQQQALNAELEQLRVVTTADIEATQRRLLQLQDELGAARKLSNGGSAPEELERLRMLLDEAREEANSARAEADRLREQVNGAQDTAEVSDEMAAMRVQLADIQCRVDEAMSLRDRAEREVAQLRQELQAQQPRQSVPQPVETIDDQPRRSRAWLGLAAGLILGAGGAGAALWFLPATQGIGAGAQAPSVATPVAPPATLPSPPPVAQPPKATTPTKAAAPQGKPAESPAAVAAPAARAPVTAARELQDSLGNGRFAPRLVEIPAVTFSMGGGVSSLDTDEWPRHEVELRRFAIGEYEVTFDEYDHFARMTGRALPDDKGRGRGKRPVVNITWEEAVAYTRWLSDQTGARYRLPSEAEWEYAAGGGARTLYWWGNAPGEGQANCFNCGSEWDNALPAPVGSFAPNPLGLHDTAGNVAEWIQDCYNADYVGAPRDGSAWDKVGCTRRVVRGGGFNSPVTVLRLTKRGQQLSSVRLDDVGFRVVREP